MVVFPRQSETRVAHRRIHHRYGKISPLCDGAAEFIRIMPDIVKGTAMIRHLLAFALLALPGAAMAEEPPTGYWLTGKKGVIVNVHECGENTYCARTVWLKKPNHKDGTLKLDNENPDPALRDRPLCGIEVITGLRPDEEGGWTGGLVYDPKTGKRFDFDMKRTDEGMHVRGYLGTPLLGKSEDWVKADLTGLELCEAQ